MSYVQAMNNRSHSKSHKRAAQSTRRSGRDNTASATRRNTLTALSPAKIAIRPVADHWAYVKSCN